MVGNHFDSGARSSCDDCKSSVVRTSLLKSVFHAFQHCVGGKVWPVVSSQSFGVNVTHKLHSLPLTVAYELFKENCRRNVDFFFFLATRDTFSGESCCKLNC